MKFDRQELIDRLSRLWDKAANDWDRGQDRYDLGRMEALNEIQAMVEKAK